MFIKYPGLIDIKGVCISYFLIKN